MSKTNYQVAVAWTNGESASSHNGNLWSSGNILYSYSTPIAIIRGSTAFVTTEYFSVTTSQHVNEARSAAWNAGGLRVVSVPKLTTLINRGEKGWFDSCYVDELCDNDAVMALDRVGLVSAARVRKEVVRRLNLELREIDTHLRVAKRNIEDLDRISRKKRLTFRDVAVMLCDAVLSQRGVENVALELFYRITPGQLSPMQSTLDLLKSAQTTIDDNLRMLNMPADFRERFEDRKGRLKALRSWRSKVHGRVSRRLARGDLWPVLKRGVEILIDAAEEAFPTVAIGKGSSVDPAVRRGDGLLEAFKAVVRKLNIAPEDCADEAKRLSEAVMRLEWAASYWSEISKREHDVSMMVRSLAASLRNGYPLEARQPTEAPQLLFGGYSYSTPGPAELIALIRFYGSLPLEEDARKAVLDWLEVKLNNVTSGASFYAAA